ncbi:MAG: metallophosphoesterase [Bacteroidota bacterium]|jgi:predicted MPP superfamily phosphohydrolase
MFKMMIPLLFLLFFILLDWYVFQALKVVSGSWNSHTVRRINIGYWIVSIVSIGLIVYFIFFGSAARSHIMRNYLFAVVACIFFAKFISGFFFLIDDFRRLIQYFGAFFIPALKPQSANEGISRSVFFSWMGFVTGGGLLGSLLYGFGNKYRYAVRNVHLSFENLPNVFKGLKIVHISDIHSGSFTDPQAVQRGVHLINQQNADLILFTGDLVNYDASEMYPYISMFKSLSSRYGIWSTLGNHDYGFHKGGSSEDMKALHMKNALEVENIHNQLGWKLLRNENIIIEKDNHQLAIIGVENISARSGFPSYGNLEKAYQGIDHIPFKILMSHDPSHWNAEVTKSYHDIQLTLSGHTHGMQFGFEIPGFRWSPVKYIYKQWAGLYQDKNQKLYVNRGFGFIGYPGRVGILPEITVLELV